MRFQSLTIRARLLWLTLGLVIPLVLVGVFNLWSFRQISRAQLDESLVQQAKLAARAFEQRILAERQTLETIAALSNGGENSFTMQDYLESIVETRPQWLDVQIVNEAGDVVLAQKSKPPNLPPDAVRNIKNEAQRENAFVIATEESADRRMNLLSLALPLENRNTVVARINGASVSEVFEKLNLPEDNLIAVFDKNNRLLYRNHGLPEQMSLDAGGTPLFTALSEKREGTIEVESPYDRVHRVYGLARVETTNSIVAVGIPSANLYEPARRQFARQLLFGSLIALAAIVAAFVIARGIVKPMRILSGAAQRFGAGDLTARAAVVQSGVIGELGQTFNQMAERIAEREEEMKTLDRLKSEFVSSVSHELRTPLTTIKTLTRVLQSDKISAAERREFLETIASECDRQIDFVQNLLDLSRIESGAYKISLSAIDVVKVIWESIEAQQRTAISRRLNLKFNATVGNLPPALTDAGALRQIVSSLVENAMKYTPEGGEIVVAAARAENRRIVVEIADNGCGIAAEDVPHIFEKFYRGRPLGAPSSQKTGGALSGEDECAAASETAGVGLGLYLVHNLVKQINAEITVKSPIDKNTHGTKFTVSLPISS